VVTSPIVGVTKPGQLADAVAAVDVELTDEELKELGSAYEPHSIAGHH
jgi:aryl-alcohol dehydrogenase (NADP+)